MTASDVPTHHFLGGIVDLVLRAWSKGLPPLRGSLFLPSTTGSPCGSISPTGRQTPFRCCSDRSFSSCSGTLWTTSTVWTRKTSPTTLLEPANAARRVVCQAGGGGGARPHRSEGPGSWTRSTTLRRAWPLGVPGSVHIVQPLYNSRAANSAAHSDHSLSVGLRSALMALRRLVDQARPRLVVVGPLRRRFLPGWLGGRMVGGLFCSWTATSSTTMASFDRSTWPPSPPGRPLSMYLKLSPSQAPQPVLDCFMDNVAGQFALMKGCGATGKTQRHPRFVLGPGGRQAVGARLP